MPDGCSRPEVLILSSTRGKESTPSEMIARTPACLTALSTVSVTSCMFAAAILCLFLHAPSLGHLDLPSAHQASDEHLFEHHSCSSGSKYANCISSVR